MNSFPRPFNLDSVFIEYCEDGVWVCCERIIGDENIRDVRSDCCDSSDASFPLRELELTFSALLERGRWLLLGLPRW